MSYEGKLVAKWHTFYFDAKVDDRGTWLRITETRPNGHRQSILIEASYAGDFQRELLKAVSEIGGEPEQAHSAGAVRPRGYAEWSDREDEALRFLYKLGNSIGEIGQVLHRERGAIRSRLGHLEIPE